MVSVAPGSPDSVIRLSQPLYGEVLRAGLPVLRARTLRLQLAETVAHRSPLTPDDALRIARWRLDAGADSCGGISARGWAGRERRGRRRARRAAWGAGTRCGSRPCGRARDRSGSTSSATGSRLPRVCSPRPRLRRPATRRSPATSRSACTFSIGGCTASTVAHDFLERAAAWSDAPEWPRRLDPWRLLVSGFVDGVDGDSDGTRARIVGGRARRTWTARANRQMRTRSCVSADGERPDQGRGGARTPYPAASSNDRQRRRLRTRIGVDPRSGGGRGLAGACDICRRARPERRSGQGSSGCWSWRVHAWSNADGSRALSRRTSLAGRSRRTFRGAGRLRHRVQPAGARRWPRILHRRPGRCARRPRDGSRDGWGIGAGADSGGLSGSRRGLGGASAQRRGRGRELHGRRARRRPTESGVATAVRGAPCRR